MKIRRIWMRGVAAAGCMLVMILDAKTAIISAREGVALCLRTVIPSLFPLFILSGIISGCLLGLRMRLLQPLGRLCKIPKGAESLLILGLLAGYPIGAQLITQVYREGKLSSKAARRMLGFCNNAGPAFLFGMLSPLFADNMTVWALWGIHILSSLFTGWLLPDIKTDSAWLSLGKTISFAESLQNGIKAMASVCGWVVIFRVLLGFCNRWFLWLFPIPVQVLISGTLELANGCVLLESIPIEGLRFVLAGIMLSFGGLCVGMQTLSVTEGLGTGWYFPGKVLQTILTILLSFLIQPILFKNSEAIMPSILVLAGLVLLLGVLIFALRGKKVLAFSKRLLYNIGN